jgi:hypothetical protein
VPEVKVGVPAVKLMPAAAIDPFTVTALLLLRVTALSEDNATLLLMMAVALVVAAVVAPPLSFNVAVPAPLDLLNVKLFVSEAVKLMAPPAVLMVANELSGDWMLKLFAVAPVLTVIALPELKLLDSVD